MHVFVNNHTLKVYRFSLFYTSYGWKIVCASGPNTAMDKLFNCLWIETVAFKTGLVFVLTFVLTYKATRRPRGIPPGPALFPFFGNIHTMAVGDLLENLQSLRRKYGDVFSLYIGRELMIFLNGHSAIHDAFVKKGSLFTGRPITEFHKMWVKCPGIIFATGQEWKDQRRISVQILQDLCSKQNGETIEKVIKSEIQKLLEVLETQTEAFDIDSYLTVSVCNVICQIVYSTSYNFNDPVIKDYLSEVQTGAKVFMIAQTLCNCFPFLRKLPFDVIKAKRIEGMEAKVRAFMEHNVSNVKRQSLNLPDNFVKQYLQRIQSNQDKSVCDTIDETHLVSVLMDLFAAGTETTANTLRWIILHLLNKPHFQDQMYEELISVIGDKPVGISDRARLPFTQSVILEGLRIAPAVPLGIPHTVPHDIVYRGYKIPQNCSVLANINSALKDPDVWRNPEQFRPQRFLNESQTSVVVPKELIPFSAGPRSCIGETFSKVELHLFASALFKNLKFFPETDGFVPDTRGNIGVSLSPPSFRVRVKKRPVAH